MSTAPYVVWRESTAVLLHNCAPRRKELCVDLRFGADEIKERYGEYVPGGWHHIPLKEFPPEFRMHLLLMGVS